MAKEGLKGFYLLAIWARFSLQQIPFPLLIIKINKTTRSSIIFPYTQVLNLKMDSIEQQHQDYQQKFFSF